MNCCSCCGSSIPDEQSVCSMCYGDPYFGSDGYYLQELEDEERREQARLEDMQSDELNE